MPFDTIHNNTSHATKSWQFLAVTDGMPLQIWTAQPDGTIDYINPYFANYFGIKLDDILNKRWRNLIHPDDLPRCLQRWKECLPSGEPYEIEYRLRRADGVYLWHLGSAFPVLDNHGNLHLWFGTNTDIHSRKEAEQALKNSELRLMASQSRAKLGSWQRDLSNNTGEWSAEMYRLFGLDPTRAPPPFSGVAAVLHPDDQAMFSQYNEHLKNGGNDYSFDFRIPQKDGSTLWLEARSETIRNAQGQVVMLRGTAQDITQRKQSEQALQTIKTLLDESQTIAKLGGWELNLITGQLFWTDETYRLHDASPTEFNPTVDAALNFYLQESRERLLKALNAAMNDGTGYDLELETLTFKGRKIDLRATCQVTMQDGKAVKLTGILQDISEQKAAQRALELSNRELERTNKALESIAHFDALTHLPNRVLLADRMQQAMIINQRNNKLMAVAFLDLDGFKTVNDLYGHSLGDELLITLAYAMKGALREGDTLARIGGDEFVAVLSDLAQPEDCAASVNRLLEAASKAVTLNNKLLQVSASIGVTIFPQDGADADQLLRHADQAMYVAKQSGKNCFHLFDVAKDVAVKTQREELENIRLALENNEFVLYYQPKVNMRTGEVIGAEALIRWQHPERGLLPPAVFLPIIDNHFISITMGEWVIATALTQIENWTKQGLHIPVSVNIGALQLQQSDFSCRLKQLLDSHQQVNPKKLELEILETSALEDIAQVSSVISACQSFGVTFALDDFGTGYSSLAYLKRLPTELLKIDQTFVRDMLEDPDDLAIIAGIIGLAKAFRRNVIAEGVETIAHGEKLLSIGCELAQGYGIARPMPAEAIPQWVSSWRPDAAWRK